MRKENSGNVFFRHVRHCRKGTIPDAVRHHSVPNDIRRHRLISISYISLLPCHGRGPVESHAACNLALLRQFLIVAIGSLLAAAKITIFDIFKTDENRNNKMPR
jgi:hypothetical protein